LIEPKPQIPEPVQRQQTGRRIGAAAPEPTADRNLLIDTNIDASTDLVARLQ
jgi:hypothetical protein